MFYRVFVIALFYSAQLHSSPKIKIVTENSYQMKNWAAAYNALPNDNCEKSQENRIFMLVSDVMEDSGIDYDIDVLPWSRALENAKREKNVLIYPLARTQERENEFLWVGKIISTPYYLYKLKSREEIIINDLMDANQYEIGVSLSYHLQDYLKNNDFKNINYVSNDLQNYYKLLSGRIDLFPKSTLGLKYLCTYNNDDCSLFEPAYELDEISDGIYMAFSLGSDKNIVSKARKSFTKIIQNPKYSRIN